MSWERALGRYFAAYRRAARLRRAGLDDAADAVLVGVRRWARRVHLGQ